MNVEIITPEAYLYSGEIKSISLPGELGIFEIQHNHAPLISTLIKGKIKIVEPTGYTETFEVNGGVVEVVNNEIKVLIENLS